MLIRCGENWIDPKIVGSILVHKAFGLLEGSTPSVTVGSIDGRHLVQIPCPDDEEARLVADFIAEAVNGEPRP